MEVWIFRHGETDWNVEKRLQGKSDTDLNENGINVAKKVHEVIKDIRFDFVFSSPLKRAVNTAKILTDGMDLEIVTDERLKEMSFGVNEGRYPEERVGHVEVFFEKPGEYEPCEGGESIEEVNARTRSFIEEILVPLSESRPDSRVMISGHGAMNKSLAQTLCHKSKADFWEGTWQSNLYVAKFNINGSNYEMYEDFHSLIEE